tara:strand:+ start:5452 stop:5712 length:261 start_codon:yes stop_codon:yes gene_type:complete
MNNENVTYQCVECDSTEILMADAVCEWDVTNQRWRVTDESSVVYFCKTPDEHMNNEVNEIAIQEYPFTLDDLDDLEVGFIDGGSNE